MGTVRHYQPSYCSNRACRNRTPLTMTMLSVTGRVCGYAGLHDPVKYRSNITREYIAHANAVLVAVKLGALTEEPLETITTVLDYAGNNRDKVFIVGTQ